MWEDLSGSQLAIIIVIGMGKLKHVVHWLHKLQSEQLTRLDLFSIKKLQLPCVFLSTPPAASGTSGKTDPSGPVEYSSMRRKRAADQRRHVEQAPIVVPTTTATTILLIITAACNMHLNIHIGINIKIMCRQGRALPATCLVV